LSPTGVEMKRYGNVHGEVKHLAPTTTRAAGVTSHNPKRKETTMTMKEMAKAVGVMHDCLEGVVSEQGYEALYGFVKDPFVMMARGRCALAELRRLARAERKGGAK